MFLGISYRRRVIENIEFPVLLALIVCCLCASGFAENLFRHKNVKKKTLLNNEVLDKGKTMNKIRFRSLTKEEKTEPVCVLYFDVVCCVSPNKHTQLIIHDTHTQHIFYVNIQKGRCKVTDGITTLTDVDVYYQSIRVCERTDQPTK